MQGASRVSLDEIPLRILLLLSSKQSLTIHNIARAIDQPEDIALKAANTLEQRNLIQSENDRFQITKVGLNLLLEKGIRLPLKPESPAKSKVSPQPIKIPLFGTLLELFYWSILPIILIITEVVLSYIFLKSYKSSFLRDLSMGGLIVALLVLLVIYVIKSFRKVLEYESMVIFRLGKCIGEKGPGPVLILPFLDNPQLVELRVRHQEVPHETCITQDNVQIDVDFVFYWKIQQPVWSVTRVTDPDESIRLLATALLRAVIAHFPFNDVLNQRESINDLLKEKIDEISSEWGVYVTTMEIREIKPPTEIVESMHKQRAAEWQRAATVIDAEAQAQALKLLYAVATMIDDKTLNLKYFETLRDLGKGQSTKYIFPLELTNLVRPLLHAIKPEEDIPSVDVDDNAEG